jgi:hypothetical protein
MPNGAVQKIPRPGSSASLEERKFQLDLEKHARERLWREDARIGQALTWLFTSQALLGGSYAYLKQQVIVAMERNWVMPWMTLRKFVEYFPFVAVALCLVFLCTVLAIGRAQTAVRRAYPQVFDGESWLARAGPAGPASIGVLFTVGWFVVLFALP